MSLIGGISKESMGISLDNISSGDIYKTKSGREGSEINNRSRGEEIAVNSGFTRLSQRFFIEGL